MPNKRDNERHRRHEVDTPLTLRKLLNAQKRFLEAAEAESEHPARDEAARFQSRVETLGLAPERGRPIGAVLSRKAAKRKRKSRQKAGASTWEKENAKLGMRDILRPFPGGRRLLDRVPSAKAPMTPREYARYLTTPHWQTFTREYREADDVLHECFVCGNVSYELHHHTYAHLGDETLHDVVPLCRAHHEACHQAVKSGQTTLARAHTYIKARYTAGQPLGLRVNRLE